MTFLNSNAPKNQYGLLAKFDQIYYSWGAISPMGGYIFGQKRQRWL